VTGSPSAGAGLSVDGSGRLGVTGPVTFATVGELLRASQALFAGQKAMTVDLAAVTSVDSAGLALLLEWLRLARSEGRTVAYTGLPDKLIAIAKLSGVHTMLAAGIRPAA
jgi:phospholipid transport system transporter-binding protein